MLYNYTSKLSPDQVEVVLRCEDSARDESLKKSLEERGQRFGYALANWDEMPELSPGRRTIRHLIYVLAHPFSEKASLECSILLRQFTTISIAFAYKTKEEMLAYMEQVEGIKSRFGDRINFLRPDTESHNSVYVSDSKILENAVCDTIRIKYAPKRLDGDLQYPLTNEQLRYFEDACERYRTYKLWHRSPTDGYLALRTGDSSFLITGTKTNKEILQSSEISHVQRYDVESNTLVYVGKRLPSSDAVEAAIVFDRCKHIGAIVHTHGNRYFTRSEQYAHMVRVGRLPYGEPELGFALVKQLEAVGTGFLIMDDHGEVFVGPDGQSVLRCIDQEVALAQSGGSLIEESII